MSTDPLKEHTFENVSRLSIVYLRSALNNPQWAGGIEDYSRGATALSSVPKWVLPKNLQTDEDVFAWGEDGGVSFKLSDEVRDTCRTALKKAFEIKLLPVNPHAVALITLFKLKS